MHRIPMQTANSMMAVVESNNHKALCPTLNSNVSHY